jgi:cytochrome c biogenesis protein CcmG/thiol:disulfide interchange protein DsbE
MLKKTIFSLMIAGLALSFTPFLRAGELLPQSAPDCKTCPSFGVQRFLEKRQAPPFSLKTLDKNEVSFNSLKGKPTMLTFWATWCPTCREELPVLDKYFGGKRDQLNIVTLAIDGESDKKIQRYVNLNKITLPVLLDVKEKIARIYGVRMIPCTFLIDREGFLIGMVVGEKDWSQPQAWAVVRELFSLS